MSERWVLGAILAAACGPSPAAEPPAAAPSPVVTSERAAPAERCDARCTWLALTRAVDSAVADGVAPGAVVGVSVGGQRFLHGTGGLGIGDSTRPGPHTVYDMASLTKVVALTTAVMFAVDDGRLSLDDPVSRWIPEYAEGDKSAVTVRHLLTHSSGLPAHRPLWTLSSGPDDALNVVRATPLDTVAGARAVYSDLGAILLTQIVQQATGEPLDRYVARRVFEPLGMRDTRFRPPESWLTRIAPTEQDPWRGRMLHGEVHDENAAWLGGVSGHAGLFSSATDLLTFGEWLLGEPPGPATAITAGSPGPARPRSAAEFVVRQDVVPGSSRALGWDTPSPRSSAGTRLSSSSFGHTGFTGTSIWLDPDRRLVVVLLTNRVHPTRENTAILRLRPQVSDLAAGLADAVARELTTGSRNP